MLTVFVIWIGLAVAVGVIANSRGRSGPGWAILALVISPLIAGIIVLALPSMLVPASQTPFTPQAVLQGIPYRVMRDGRIEAMMQGGRIVFQSLDQLSTAIAGGTLPGPDPEMVRQYPSELNGYRYCVVNEQVFALTPAGTQVSYPNWKAFWTAVHG
jgi:hypothetical protein